MSQTAPTVLVGLVNLRLPRRPPGTAATAGTQHPDPLADTAAATRALEPLLPTPQPVRDVDLGDLRRLHDEVVALTTALLTGGALPPPRHLNRLAGRNAAAPHLDVHDHRLQVSWYWQDRPVPAVLARVLIEELQALDPARLRRCARPECALVFYDTTRSGTRRWHAESPCGWRERQRRHRTAPPT
jgi:predicted RNA-binding Zn ribbon-like protein